MIETFEIFWSSPIELRVLISVSIVMGIIYYRQYF